jgi:predicted DNA-binding mobile mystery protein A
VFRNLPLDRLDAALGRWRQLPYVRPHGGWLRAIRTALGMTTRQLAARVGVSQAAVVDAERNESGGDITLNTLRRYAAALDCEVFYALVPRQPLHERLETQAQQLASAEVARARLAMSLEDQAQSASRVEREVAALRAELLRGRRSRLWR